MRIREIALWRVPLRLKTPFGLSGGRVTTELSTTVARMTAEDGAVGWGEGCPWGSDYLAAFPEGVAAGCAVVAPQLLGLDPRDTARLADRVDATLRGQPAVKSVFDMAAHDLAARVVGEPLWRRLGGRRLAEGAPIPGAIGQDPGPDADTAIRAWRARGVRLMSGKAHGDGPRDAAFIRFALERLEPDERLKLDANGGWRLDHALIAAEAADARVTFEQPCATYEDCRAFVRSSGRPVVLDETALTVSDILRGHADGMLAGVNIKIGRVGGLTTARLMRDLCAELGLPMFVQDTGGADLARAAITHLAAGAPERLLHSVWDCAVILENRIGRGGVVETPSRLAAADAPGLGVEVDEAALGAPFAVIGGAR